MSTERRRIVDDEGRVIFNKTIDGDISLSYLPNGQIESKTIRKGNIETYQEFDFMGRILRNVKKINGETVIDLTYIYRLFRGVWLCKCAGTYNKRDIVLNRKESKYEVAKRCCR